MQRKRKMKRKIPAKNKMFGRKKKTKEVAVEPPTDDEELEELEELEDETEEEESADEDDEEEISVKKNSVVQKKIDTDEELTEEKVKFQFRTHENVLRVHDETLKRILYHLRI